MKRGWRILSSHGSQAAAKVEANPASGPADTAAARELQLFVENDADLYRQQTTPIMQNLLRKMKAGKYDHALAPRLWLYLVDNGAKKYIREYVQSSTPGSAVPRMDSTFNLNTRRLVAQRMADEFKQAADAGEYSALAGRDLAERRARALTQAALRKKANPFTRVSYDARTTRLFRSGKTGRWARPGRAKNPPTRNEINVLHFKISSAVIAHDRRQQKKPGYNRYALPQYLAAADATIKEIKNGIPLRTAIVSHFTGRLLDSVLKSVGEPTSTIQEQRSNPISKDEWGKGAGRVYASSTLKRFDFTPADVRSAFSRKLSPEEITELYGGPEGYAKGIRKEHATIMSRLSKKGVIPPQASFGASGDLLDYIRSQGWAPPAAVARAGAALEKRQLTDAEKKALRAWWKKNPPRSRELSFPERHQLKVARDTLRMPDAIAAVMGGPTKEEAREIIFRLTGKREKENPLNRKETAEVLRWGRRKSKQSALRLRPKLRALLAGEGEAAGYIAQRWGKAKPRGWFSMAKQAEKVMSVANPPRRAGLPEIYAGTDSITMTKGRRSNWPGQRFIHKFKSKPKQFAVARGSTLTTPDGRTFKVDTVSVLLTGKKDLAKTFSYPGGKRA